MKYLFIFVFFHVNSIYNFKQVLEDKSDCLVLGNVMRDLFLPHLLAKGKTPDEALKIVADNTRCLPIHDGDDKDSKEAPQDTP